MLGVSRSFTLLSVENNSYPAPKKIVEVTDSRAAVTVTLDMVLAGVLCLWSTSMKFVAANRGGSQGSGEKPFPLKSSQATHRRIIFWV